MVNAVDVVVTHDDADLTVLAVNRSQDGTIPLEVDLSAWKSLELIEATCLTSDDVEATNTVDAPDRVRPFTLPDVTIDDGIVTADLPRISWAVLRLRHRRHQ
jgi:alpha-N-arabinofuranosidase